MNFKINDNSFVPTAMDFFGDYVSIQALNNIVRPIWMQMNRHRLKIFTALLNPGDLDWAMYTPKAGAPANQVQAQTGEQNESLWFQYRIREEENVSLSVVDIWGKTVCNIFTNKPMERGRKEYILDLAHRNIPAGTYAYKLETKNATVYKPIVIY